MAKIKAKKVIFKNRDGEYLIPVTVGSLEIGDIGFTQMAIDETKGKRRYLNGQVIIQEQYTVFTNKLKSAVAFNPDLACTEDEWQTELTMSANGVCEKFVIDDEAGTIRLPKYPQYLDLTNNTSGASAKTQTVSVKGTGKSLGVYDGTHYGSLCDTGECISQQYNVNVGTARGSIYNNSKTFGVVKDASKSGLTGSVTIPAVAGVTSEKIKGTYFIQVATGAETEDNIINEIELNNPFSLLDYKYSEYELNNISWLRSEGQYNSKAIYPAVYDLLLKIYNGTETKAGVSVKLTTETFTDYDFVLNTAEETFRLPVKVKLASGKAVVGNGYGIAFHEGSGDNIHYIAETNNESDVGYIYGTDAYDFDNPQVAGATVSQGTGFSNNKIIGLATSGNTGIETSDSGLYLYFYVGETVQNANLINAGRIEEKLVDMKADIAINTAKVSSPIIALCTTKATTTSSASSTKPAVVIQNYVSGTSWYRVWSDGWKEQGGKVTSTKVTVTFLKAFSNTNYTVSVTNVDTGSAGTYENFGTYSRSKTSMLIGVGGTNYGAYSYPVSWYACGY